MTRYFNSPSYPSVISMCGIKFTFSETCIKKFKQMFKKLLIITFESDPSNYPPKFQYSI